MIKGILCQIKAKAVNLNVVNQPQFWLGCFCWPEGTVYSCLFTSTLVYQFPWQRYKLLVFVTSSCKKQQTHGYQPTRQLDLLTTNTTIFPRSSLRHNKIYISSWVKCFFLFHWTFFDYACNTFNPLLYFAMVPVSIRKKKRYSPFPRWITGRLSI